MNTPIELLLELAALKRYGKNGHPNRSEHLVTLNVPKEFLDRLDAAIEQHEFKNFHRLLCERFGYTHDEKDWKRDQLSLIEYIAGNLDSLKHDIERHIANHAADLDAPKSSGPIREPGYDIHGDRIG